MSLHPFDSERLARELAEEKAAQDRIAAERGKQLSELRQLQSSQAITERIIKAIRETVPLLSPPELRPYTRNPGKPKQVWVLVVSDLQYGQKTEFNDSGGVFEQSSEIATEQFKILWDRVDELLGIASHSVEVPELHLFFLGDMHDGDDLRLGHFAKVDAPVMVQCVEVNDLEAGLIQNCLTRFERVVVRNVGGNHDRNSQKPGTAGLGVHSMINTFAWLGGEILRRRFQHAIDAGRLTIKNYTSFFGADWIAGQRFVFEHGASFKASTGSYGGISYYSLVNAASGYERMLSGADVIMWGHFHQPMILPRNGGWGWQVVNGAFPPSTEFVQSNFKGVGRPTQWLLKFHEGTGMIGAEPIYLDTSHVTRPGDYWIRLRDETDQMS